MCLWCSGDDKIVGRDGDTVEDLIAGVDMDGDGEIDYNEFLEMMRAK